MSWGPLMADFGGRYSLVRRIGVGGMGEVWLASDEVLGDRLVAIKRMHPHMLADTDDMARFQREMRLAARMNHPNIMTVYTTDSHNGVPFMVMEYLEGSDLGELQRTLGIDEIAQIGRDTCSALRYAHGLSPGVIHRDIKPGNLFICESGQVKVTDFGIAKAVSGTKLSVTGTLVGTLPYMAPEQWLGEPVAFSNDVWAVGCVLYELLSGRLPRSYATPTEYLTAATRREPVTPLPLAAGTPTWLSDAVMTMLEPDPRSRPTAAQSVQLLSGPPAFSAPVPATQATAAAYAYPNTLAGNPLQQARTLTGRAGAPADQSIATGGRPPRRGRAHYAAFGVAAIVAVGAVVFAMTRGSTPGSAAGDSPRLSPSQLVSTSAATSPASRTAASAKSPETQSPPIASTRAIAEATSWSQPTAIDQSAQLNGVSCAATDQCVAVDNNGNIFIYKGTSWSSSASTSDLLGAVSCPSTSFCATVGYDGNGGNVYTLDDGSWSAPDLIDADRKLHSVSCSSASFCMAGASVNLFIYSAGSWSDPQSVDPNDGNGTGIESVSCVSPSFCVAVDAIGNALTYRDGSWSTPDDVDNGAALNSVSCASPSFCVAVSADGNALIYHDGSWSAPNDIDGGSGVDSVSCPTSSFCVAVDAGGNALTYTDGSWSSTRAIDKGTALDALSCVSPSFCVAVDANGNALFMK
jgi:hypothetical protein